MASDYIVLEAEDEDDLSVLVKAKLDAGYLPVGGPQQSVDHDGVYRYHQAVYKL
jgi:hypothetical protein